MTAVLGAGLLFAAAQSVLVDATPATVSAADDSEFGQTRVANEATRASTQPLRSAQTAPAAIACGYPDNCGDAGGGDVTGDDTGAGTPTLPDSRNCIGSNPAPLAAPPYLAVDDDCDDDRAALEAAGCSLSETVGIGSEIFDVTNANLQNALATRGGTNTSRYQLYTCDGGVKVTLTTSIPAM